MDYSFGSVFDKAADREELVRRAIFLKSEGWTMTDIAHELGLNASAAHVLSVVISD